MNIPFFFQKKKSRLHKKKFAKLVARYGLISAHVVALVLVVGLLTSQHRQSNQPASQQFNQIDSSSVEVAALDEISSADIAANIAIAARLPEADQVRNQADSRIALAAIAVSDDIVATKPQIITSDDTGGQSRQDILEYTVVEGDTVQSLAERFNVSSDSIRWSNDLSGNNLSPGRVLILPPKNRNGLVYRVVASDTLDAVAERFRASRDGIIAFNDLEISQSLPVNEYIFIPEGERVIVPPPVFAPSFLVASFGNSNGYSGGYCTWHAANRRAEIGRPIPTNLGNAITWYARAQAMGLATGFEPQAGSVVFHTDIGGLGHVAYVEAVNSDGSVWISDMNFNGHVSMDVNSPRSGGWGRLTYRLVTPSEFGIYRFIY